MLLISLNDVCHYCIFITDNIPLLAAVSLTFIYSIIPEHSSIILKKCRNKSCYNDEGKTWIPTDQYFCPSF